MTNTFAGASLDRVSWRRTDEAFLARCAGDPAARALVTVGGELAVGPDGRPVEVALGTVESLEGTAPAFLGLRGEQPVYAIEAAAVPDGARAASLRDLVPLLTQSDGGTVAYATAIGNWHRRHRFCANCGHATDVVAAGFQRTCPNCGTHHFPRTDPVVIMLVVDPTRDRVLLGRQAAWPTGRYSCLAGFVEPGESLEEAVAREVVEESAVQVADVVYRSSQPWPFPASLMLGFRCHYVGGGPYRRDGELEDVRWFEREDLADGQAILPPPLAIARVLIDEWLGEEA